MRRWRSRDGDGPAVAVMDGVAHLCPDQACIAQVMVAGDELVPERAFPGPAHHGADLQRLQVVETGRSREQRRFGLRPEHDRSLGGAGSSACPVATWCR